MTTTTSTYQSGVGIPTPKPTVMTNGSMGYIVEDATMPDLVGYGSTPTEAAQMFLRTRAARLKGDTPVWTAVVAA